MSKCQTNFANTILNCAHAMFLPMQPREPSENGCSTSRRSLPNSVGRDEGGSQRAGKNEAARKKFLEERESAVGFT